MIDATQLIAPRGPLEPAPKEDSNVFTARVQAYVDSAYANRNVVAATTQAVKDQMAAALASYHGLMADYRRMLREPNSVTVTEKGTSTYTDAQRAGVLALANQYLAEFQGLVEVTPDVPAVVQKVAVRTFVRW